MPAGCWPAALEALVLAGALTALAAYLRGFGVARPWPAGAVHGLAQLFAVTLVTATLGLAAGRWAVAFAVASSLVVGEATRRRGIHTVLVAWGLVLRAGAGILLAAGVRAARHIT